MAIREYVDGLPVERNIGAPSHSALQKILIVHLAAFEKPPQNAVWPECRTRVAEARYRAPFLVIEILSPEDRMRETMQRFRDYENLGVTHIIQMDPEDRSTFAFLAGDLVRRELSDFEVPGRGFLPFPSGELLGRLDED